MASVRPVPKHFYTQSAVIPWRIQNARIEILLISSRKKKRWVIPKGVKEPALCAAASAAKEALEEAGIEGRVREPAIGCYRYRKWRGVCTVEVFLMEVVTVHESWPEDYRLREWVSLEDAVERVDEKALKKLMREVPGRVSGS